MVFTAVFAGERWAGGEEEIHTQEKENRNISKTSSERLCAGFFSIQS